MAIFNSYVKLPEGNTHGMPPRCPQRRTIHHRSHEANRSHANLCIIHVKLLKRPVISIDHDWPGDLRAYDRDHPDHPDHPNRPDHPDRPDRPDRPDHEGSKLLTSIPTIPDKRRCWFGQLDSDSSCWFFTLIWLKRIWFGKSPFTRYEPLSADHFTLLKPFPWGHFSSYLGLPMT